MTPAYCNASPTARASLSASGVTAGSGNRGRLGLGMKKAAVTCMGSSSGWSV